MYKNNAVLIFDECTSGFRENFRYSFKYKINPDLAMFGRLGNGFAINAVLGKSNIMDRKFNTFGQKNRPSTGLKTLQEMNHLKSWDIICKNGKYLRKEIKSIVRNNKDVFK